MRQNDPQKKQPHRARVYLATHKERSKHGHELVAQLENLVEDQPELVENGGKVAWEGDALHKVLGDEKAGQVHGMGLLPIPKQAYDHMPRRLKNIEVTTSEGSSLDMETHLIQELKKLEEHVKKQDIHMKKQDILIEELRNKDTCHDNKISSEVNLETNCCDNFHPHHIQSKRKRVECDVSDLDVPMTELQDTLVHNKKQKHQEGTVKKGQDHKKKIFPSTMEVGTNVFLRTTNRYPNKMPVAYATFLSSDPHAVVGGVKLGNEFWKVRVNHPIEEHEVLVRPCENYKTIGQVKGKAIAWPSFCVEKING